MNARFSTFVIFIFQILSAFCTKTSHYMGCFKFDTRHRLSGHDFQFSNLKPAVCIEECRSRGFLYAGLQQWTKCLCGNDQYALQERAYEEYECNLNCPGDALSKCGGDLTTNIYAVEQCEEVKANAGYALDFGCFKIKSDVPLNGYNFTDRRMTKSYCVEECRKKNYLYATLQRGNECVCGNEQPNRKNKMSEMDCSMKCPGEDREFCGGAYGSQLLSIGECVKIPFPEVKSSSYLGCYKQRSGPAKTLEGGKAKQFYLTTSECIDHCRSTGYFYAGLVAGQDCLCGKDQTIFQRKSAEYECNLNCANEGWKCGGIGFASIYAVKHCEKAVESAEPFYLGCFIDEEDNRRFDGLDISSSKMTPKYCHMECQQNGFLYAAVQNGYQCYCGNKHPLFRDKLLETECSSPCPGTMSKNCGGVLRNGVYSVGHCLPPPYTGHNTRYMGCFESNTEMALKGYNFNDVNLKTKECFTVCRKQGFIYGAILQGKTCMCGNDHVPFTAKVDEDDCKMTCHGENWRCGGKEKFVLYNVRDCHGVENMIHNPIYLGCFADAMDRKLKGYFNVDALLTPDKCVRECKSRNFLYAGLEAKNQCFCGNEEPLLKNRLLESDCNWTCGGDVKTTCGAWWRMNVFAVGTCKRRVDTRQYLKVFAKECFEF